MEYVMVCIVTILAEFGLMLLFHKREPEYKLDSKKYGLLLAAGNAVLMGVAVFLQGNQWFSALWYFGICSYLFCMCIYDMKFKELPDWFHLILVLFYGYLWITKRLPSSVLSSLLVALVVGLLLVVVYLIRKDAIGAGDIKVMVLCAQYAGMMIAGIVIRAMVIAFLCSIVLLLMKKVNTKSGLPFVPFLLLGALFV